MAERTNEVVRVLTLFTAVFMPVTFVAAIYGMNFARMPELDWPWGYAFAWVLMLATVAVTLVWFRRKRWL